MAQKVHFTKMHGAGNDYIYVNTLSHHIARPETAALLWSDRHKGIGSDGLVLIGEPSDASVADFSMRIFNADGSEAMMCGNASRCVGKYLYEKKLTQKTEIRLETRSGVKVLRLQLAAPCGREDGRVVESVTVDMGLPRFDVPSQYRPDAVGQPVGARSCAGAEASFVSMGNPHYVVFVDDIAQVDVAGDGGLLEYDARFPQRCNIEFAQVLQPQAPEEPHGHRQGPPAEIRTRVWERGSGITMACGTGACATAVAAMRSGRVAGRQCLVRMDGGDLQVEWRESDGHVYLSGPAAFVFEGDVPAING
ncbi:MAG: diaminopimelate epimerase [Prevotella sp.]|nr:diaminopimelate epimerase [Prevotella sp.]